jgi:hypothetical protein
MNARELNSWQDGDWLYVSESPPDPNCPLDLDAWIATDSPREIEQ